MFASLACQEAHSCAPRSRTMVRAFGVAGLVAIALLAMSVMSSTADARTTVLLVHGGAWVMGEPEGMNPLRDELSAEGIKSRAVAYRTDTSGFIPSELGRVRLAVRAEKRRGNRVILYGISAGAQLSLALAARGEVDGVVASSAPIDLLNLQYLDPAVIGMTDLQAYQMSPLRRLNKRAAPTLLMHGDVDPLVPIDQSQQYLAAARHYQHDVRLITMTGVGHVEPPYAYRTLASKWIKHRMR